MERWYIHCKKAEFARISQKFHISPILARIIRNRDVITDDEIEKYLNIDLKNMYDPFLMKGMNDGIRLMSDSIRLGRKIRVIGDYDVDGVCSSFILKAIIQKAGGNVDVRLPDRILEGYGMNEVMAEEAHSDGISLIITCDNGVSSYDAVNLARMYGIDVILTDHHEIPSQLPAANVIIDPKQADCNYPFKEICGAGVAYKFAQALNSYCNLHAETLLDDLLQFAGMATIADIVPLQDENRIFASEGIQRLRNTTNTGLNALMKVRGLTKENLNAGSIGYVLGPCINSAGRLKNAIIAFQLLEEKDPFHAEKIANELSALNEERKNLTMSQGNIAFQKLNEKAQASERLEKVLVLYLPEAHESVAGIIAGRVKDEYNRPAIVITRSEEGLKGSGRSTDSYNLIGALQQIPDVFQKYGGHAKACGFTLKMKGTEEETVENLSALLNANCFLSEKDLDRVIWADMQLPVKYINEFFVKELEKLEPFGMNNEKPLFAERNLKVNSAAIIGKNNNVLKMNLEDSEGCQVEGIFFGNEKNVQEHYYAILEHPCVSILYYPGINEFNGRKTPQAVIKTLQISN